jgi:hypothetical protein
VRKKGTISKMPIVREVGHFFMAFNGQWLTRMSGPLTVPFTLLALFLPSSRVKLLFSIMAIVCGVVSAFGVWVVEHRARLAAEGSIGRTDGKKSDYSSEWKELAARFEKLPNHIGANWQCQRKNNATVYEAWDFTGGIETQAQTLCRYAGRLLMKSPNVMHKLSENVTKQSDPGWKWLVFLKEHTHSFRHDGMPGQGEDGTLYLLGSIYQIGIVSQTVCLDCAGVEL